MQRHSISSGLAVVLAVSACSPSAPPYPAEDERRTFSVEDRRAARALSIGHEGPQENASPQYKAMVCSIALDAIASRINGGAVLSEEQQRAFREARMIYDRRARTGVSSDEQAAMRNEIEMNYPELANRARFALSCLRDLA